MQTSESFPNLKSLNLTTIITTNAHYVRIYPAYSIQIIRKKGYNKLIPTQEKGYRVLTTTILVLELNVSLECLKKRKQNTYLGEMQILTIVKFLGQRSNTGLGTLFHQHYMPLLCTKDQGHHNLLLNPKNHTAMPLFFHQWLWRI